MSSTLLVFIQYTLSGNNNFHKTILKKQKCETVLAENVCKPLKAEEEIFQGRRDVENATKYKKDLFFSSSHPDTQTTVSLTTRTKKKKKKKKSQNKTYIHCFNFIHNNLGEHCFR